METVVKEPDEVREAAKQELRRRMWASNRGKATRTFIREHPEVVREYSDTGDIMAKRFPEHVTKASVMLELSQRAKRKETARAVKQWKEENPEEAARLAAEVEAKLAGEAE